MKRVVIVGGGFSGAAAAILLGRWSTEPLHLLLVEPRAEPGMGLAHSTPIGEHRLNGTDAIHSPYPDAPDHFAGWLRDSGALRADPQAVTPEGRVFPRRLDFGRYMAGELARHARANPSGSRIEHVHEVAIGLDAAGDRVALRLARGAALDADHCIVALGWNEVGVPGPLRPLAGDPGWIGDPWDPARWAGVGPDAPVLIVGGGLTASDAFAALTASGHCGPVTMLSRHGLRPASQNPYRPGGSIWERVLDPDPEFLRRHGAPGTLREVLRALRADIAAVDLATSSWHTPFDALRDAVAAFWPGWSEHEKRRFVRHLKSRYDAARFRNPPQLERLLAAEQASGRLRHVAGRLHTARRDGRGLAVEIDPSGGGERRTLRAAAVINCTGPQPRPSASANPFWQALIASGAGRDAASGLGIDVDPGGRLVGANGCALPRVHAIGPPTIGRFGEAVAVPFVVRQLLAIAPAIVGAGVAAPFAQRSNPPSIE